MHRVSVNLYLTYTKASSVVTSHTDKRGEFHSKQLTVTDLELQVEDLKSKHSPTESLWDATIYQHEGITLSYMIKTNCNLGQQIYFVTYAMCCKFQTNQINKVVRRQYSCLLLFEFEPGNFDKCHHYHICHSLLTHKPKVTVT